MTAALFHFDDLTELQLQSLAQRLAPTLKAGGVLLLRGPVGAGKTTFARAAIKSILLEDEDVPSPTFTLVQTYETARGDLWHCDLYRVSSALEIEELGLSEAFDSAICLIEWPEVLGAYAPETALSLSFSPTNDGATRALTAHGRSDLWANVLAEAV